MNAFPDAPQTQPRLPSYSSYVEFGLFLMTLATTHMLEYTYVWKFHPHQLSDDCAFISFSLPMFVLRLPMRIHIAHMVHSSFLGCSS